MKVDIHTMEGLLSGKCLPANMLVNESLSAYLVRQFEALHDRAEAAERERDGAMSSALAVADAWVRRAKVAEAEIARRDAAAGEADGYIFCHPPGKNFWSVSHPDNAGHNGVKPFYFAAPPAVLPVVTDLAVELLTAALIDGADAKTALKLAAQGMGAQPQKPAPDGWKLVPVEPTQRMIDAYNEGMVSGGATRAYRDMLAAAPAQGGEQ